MALAGLNDFHTSLSSLMVFWLQVRPGEDEVVSPSLQVVSQMYRHRAKFQET